MSAPEGTFHLPRITTVVVQPNPRIWELFRKEEPLTADEWAELELYEAIQKEEEDEFHEG
ncbi:MAG: hypothetical protein EBS87_11945 [Sphingomonadaceae bacterium]|nr:hypothetical protein [Sphingomonadaceae bacterium]NCA02849.1 hypothetical protein [Sphingomonadaceae bacterium]